MKITGLDDLNRFENFNFVSKINSFLNDKLMSYFQGIKWKDF